MKVSTTRRAADSLGERIAVRSEHFEVLVLGRRSSVNKKLGSRESRESRVLDLRKARRRNTDIYPE